MWQNPAGAQTLRDFDALVRPRLASLANIFANDDFSIGRNLAMLDALAESVGVRGTGLTREAFFRLMLGGQVRATIGRIRRAIQERATGGNLLKAHERVTPTLDFAIPWHDLDTLRAVLRQVPPATERQVTQADSLETRMRNLVARLESNLVPLRGENAGQRPGRTLAILARVNYAMQAIGAARASVEAEMNHVQRSLPANWDVVPLLEYEIRARQEARVQDPGTLAQILNQVRDVERDFQETEQGFYRGELYAAAIDLDGLRRNRPDTRLERLKPVAEDLATLLNVDRREMLRVAGQVAANWTPSESTPLSTAFANEVLFRFAPQVGADLHAADPTDPNAGLPGTDQPVILDLDHATLDPTVRESLDALAEARGWKIQAVTVPPTHHAGAYQRSAESVQENLGLQVIYARTETSDGGVGFYGLQIPDTNVVVINIATPEEWLLAVAGHEYGHYIQENHPEIHQEIAALLNASFPEDAREEYNEALRGTRYYTEEELAEELLSDTVGAVVAERLGGERFEHLLEYLPDEVAAQIRALVPGRDPHLQAAEPSGNDPIRDILADELRALMQRVADDFASDPIQEEYDEQLRRGLAEPEGQRTMGNPRYANPAVDPQARVAYDVSAEAYRAGITPETLAFWDQEGARWIASLGGTWEAARHIVSMAMEGTMLNDMQTRGAMQLADRIWVEAIGSGDPNLIREARLFSWSYAASRTANARALASGRDPKKTPFQRNLEYVTRFMTRLSPNAQAEVDAAERGKSKLYKSKREAVEAEQDAQWARLEMELNLVGITLADIFQGDAITKLRSSRAVQRVIDSVAQSPEERMALRMILDGHSNAQIRAATRLGDTYLEALEDRFDNALLPVFEEWAGLGITLQNLPDSNLQAADLYASTPVPDHGPEWRRIQARRILRNLKPERAVRNSGRVRKVKTGAGVSQQGSYRFDLTNVLQLVALSHHIQAVNGNAYDALLELYRASLLSGPQTPVVNVIGGVVNSTIEYTIRRSMEALVNVFMRDPESAQFGELLHIWAGLAPGLAEGFTKAPIAFAHEHAIYDSEKLNEMVTLESLTEKGAGKVALSDTLFLQVLGWRGWDWMLQRFGTQGTWTTYLGVRRAASARAINELGMIPAAAAAYAEEKAREAVQDTLAYRVQRWADRTGFTIPQWLTPWRKGNPIEVTAGNVISGSNARLPYRVMLLGDQLVKYTTGRMEVAAQAYRLGKARKLKGEELSKFMEEQIATPGSEAWIKAVEKTQELTFSRQLRTLEEGGTIVEHATRAAQRWRNAPWGALRPLQLLFQMKLSFISTIYQVFATGLRGTPLGLGGLLMDGLYNIKHGKLVTCRRLRTTCLAACSSSSS